jgi:SRSO17 transposase
VEWADGTKGPLVGYFHRLRVRVTEGAVERRGEKLKAYLCWGLDDAPLGKLVAYAHLRWTIEQYHREAKQILGLDSFEGRSWKGWHHYMAMVQLAYAFLATLRGEKARGPLPTLPQAAHAVVLEVATQELLRHHRLSRRRAKGIAATMVRSLTEW